jgi:hypothetical protein
VVVTWRAGKSFRGSVRKNSHPDAAQTSRRTGESLCRWGSQPVRPEGILTCCLFMGPF